MSLRNPYARSMATDTKPNKTSVLEWSVVMTGLSEIMVRLPGEMSSQSPNDHEIDNDDFDSLS